MPKDKQPAFSTFAKLFGHISTKDKVMFARHLNVMLKAGLSLSQAFAVLIEQTPSQNFKKILENIKTELEQGQSFANSLAKYPKIFSPFFVSIVRVGETSGKLEESLEHLAKKLQKDYELINKIRGAMLYPSIILLAMVAAISLMIIYVLPQFVDIFKEINVPLPWTTRAIIAFYSIAKDFGLYFILGSLAFVILLVFAFRSKPGKIVFHRIFLKLPAIGSILKEIDLAKFSRTLNTLLLSGVPIVKSFEITSDVVANVLYKKAVFEAASFLKKGVKIVDILERNPKLFPPLVCQMTAVGEETGNLDEIFADLADFYEKEVSRTMDNLASIIEPILLIILGLGVAIIALSVVSPIYSLVEQI
jgi:type IV pilus assembly protein PilC